MPWTVLVLRGAARALLRHRKRGDAGFGTWDTGAKYKVSGARCQVSGAELGSRESGHGIRDTGAKYKVTGARCQVSGAELGSRESGHGIRDTPHPRARSVG